MEITGHSICEMFDRYNTVDEEDKRKVVDQLAGFLAALTILLTKTKKQAKTMKATHKRKGRKFLKVHTFSNGAEGHILKFIC